MLNMEYTECQPKGFQLPIFTPYAWKIIFGAALVVGFVLGALIGEWNNDVIRAAAGK